MANKVPMEGATMEKKKRRGMVALVLGLLLMLVGSALLLTVRGKLMYILPAPTVVAEGNALQDFYEDAQETMETLAASLDAWGIAARMQGTSLSGNSGSMQTVIYAVDSGYFDVNHETLLDGRFISGGDVQRGDAVIVIDEQTALSFFAGVDPLEQSVSMNGQAYTVVGVIKGQRRIGETDEHTAYIPITAAAQLPMQTVELAARSSDATTGTAILMESTLRTWREGGSFYNFDKLTLGAVMPLRWAVLFVGVAVLLSLLARLNALTWGHVCYYAEQLKTRYARDMLGGMGLSVLLGLLGYGTLAGAAYLLADFSIAPLYVFTEWVPEVVVELSSLSSRFWALNDASASAVRYVSRLNCVQEMGRSFFRWGLMALLLGIAMNGIPFLCRKVKMPTINRDH